MRAIVPHKFYAARIADRPPEYKAAFEALILERRPEGLIIDTDHPGYAALRQKFSPIPSVPALSSIAAIPRDQWSDECEQLAAHAIASDAGLGDVAARLIAERSINMIFAGSVITAQFGKTATVINIFKHLVGVDCGCDDRIRRLNELFPLG